MRRTIAMLAACGWMAACADNPPDQTAASAEFDSAAAAVTEAPDSVTDTVDVAADTAGRRRATVRDAQGQELGTLDVTETAQGIRLVGRLSGLAPGAHGIHFHAVGRCEPPFESAGPHWNPANRQHGTQNPQGPHAGDLPNLDVTGDGIADVNAAAQGGRLTGDGGLLDADGAAVVVHASADDYRTDPSGNSGDRIACGVIQ